MRVVVITGSRNWSASYPIHDAIRGADMLLVGDCPTGADKIAKSFAVANDVMLVEFVADWETHGNPDAAHLRNQAIADRAAVERDAGMPVDCYAFALPSSRGTHDCANRLRAHGLAVTIVAR